MTNLAITPPLKCHGGKFPVAKWIQSLWRPCVHRVYPFCGGAGEFWSADCEGVSEVLNDINGLQTNLFRVLKSPQLFPELQRLLVMTPFSEPEFDHAKWQCEHPEQFDIDNPSVSLAAAYFTQVRQSMSGRGDCFSPLTRRRLRRGMNEQVSAMFSAIAGLDQVHARLSRVVITNQDFRDFMPSQDGPDTMHYCDPTYLKSTRTAKNVYKFEMTEQDHIDLLALAKSMKGGVAISGYRSTLYDTELADWHRHELEVDNKSAAGKKKQRRVEVVWCNYRLLTGGSP